MANENQHQMAVVKWSQQPSVREKWPELKLMFHIPNERVCSKQQGRLLKLMGVKPGVPDLFLPVPRSRYHGLYIEMKTEVGTPSEDQKWWGSSCLLRAICGRCVTGGRARSEYWSTT